MYDIYSIFQVDPQSKPEWYFEGTFETYDKAVEFCDSKKGSWGSYFVYETGYMPIGYMKSKGIKCNDGPLYKV